MRVILPIAAVMLFLASCTDNPPLDIDVSGKPVLDTVTVDVSYYDTVNVTCGQTLVIEARNNWNFYELLFQGKVDTTSVKYLWTPTGDTTSSTAISNIPDNSLIAVEARISMWVTRTYWVNDSTTVDSTYYASYVQQLTVRGRHLPLFVVPSAFTPNGDGMNDFFNVTAICFTESHLKVFDTFSHKLIFESYDINSGWDGTHKGKTMPADEYIYHYEITSVNNEVFESDGYFELIR